MWNLISACVMLVLSIWNSNVPLLEFQCLTCVITVMRNTCVLVSLIQSPAFVNVLFDLIDKIIICWINLLSYFLLHCNQSSSLFFRLIENSETRNISLHECKIGLFKLLCHVKPVWLHVFSNATVNGYLSKLRKFVFDQNTFDSEPLEIRTTVFF